MAVQAITMPKWGLAMQEGTLAKWSVDEGSPIKAGQEIADIETTKIANVYESPVDGILRKKIVQEGDTVPVGALLAVVADSATPQDQIDGFVSDFLANFKIADTSTDEAPESQFVQVGDRRLRYLRLGPDGDVPMVMIHGFGADLGGWMFNQAALAEDRPVYALDLPGHGASSKDVADGTTLSLAGVVTEFLNAVGIARAHLVGHSLGGAIAITIAASAPDRVAALTLIAPAGFGPTISNDFIDGFIAETRAKKLRPVIEMLVADPGLISADMVEDVLKFKRLDGATEALRTIASTLAVDGHQPVIPREQIASLPMPVQVIWGEQDRVLSVRDAEGLPPAFDIVRIKNAGHIPHMEAAAQVNAVIRRLAAAR